MFDQNRYIKNYNKENYKMFPFRVRKDDSIVIDKLSSVPSINNYIVSLIHSDIDGNVLSIKQIKDKIRDIMAKHNIKDVYLFGSYARGEATASSDIDIYCESGDIKTLIELGRFEDELECALGKEVDVIFFDATLDDYFIEQLNKDKIKIFECEF